MATTQTTEDEFLIIPDNCVFNIWKCQDTGEEISITPDWYEQNGIPITPETGKDMVYLRTEINRTDYNKAVLQLSKKELVNG